MKKIILILIAIFTVTGPTNAQVVVDPSAVGNVGFFSYSGTMMSEGVDVDAVTGATANTNYLGVGQRSMYYSPSSFSFYEFQGIIEFDLAGLPTFAMTSLNWTAQLNSIGVTDDGGWGPSPTTMYVDIFDLDDDSEDGNISMADFDNTIGMSIARRAHEGGYGGITAAAVTDDPEDGIANFTNIDVTEQLRRDLFGDGMGDRTSGFVLIGSPGDGHQYILYDTGYGGSTSPNLTITVNAGDGSSNDCFIDTVK